MSTQRTIPIDSQSCSLLQSHLPPDPPPSRVIVIRRRQDPSETHTRHDDDDVLSPSLVSDLEGVGSLRPDGTSSGVLTVSCGVWHTVAVAKDTSDVYLWGWCRFGQGGR